MPSTSSVAREMSVDFRSGLEILEKLLSCHSSGIVASPFHDSVKNDIALYSNIFHWHYIVFRRMVCRLTIAK